MSPLGPVNTVSSVLTCPGYSTSLMAFAGVLSYEILISYDVDAASYTTFLLLIPSALLAVTVIVRLLEASRASDNFVISETVTFPVLVSILKPAVLTALLFPFITALYVTVPLSSLFAFAACLFDTILLEPIV